MTTYTYQPSDTTGIDTFIRADAPTTNYGTNTGIQIGELIGGAGLTARTLLKFDLSALAAYTPILTATLSLTVITDYASTTGNVDVFNVLQSWIEGEATWNRNSVADPWDTAGCANTATDREASNMGTQTTTATQVAGDIISFTLTVAKVQAWIDTPASNFGMLIKSRFEATDDGYEYASSSHATVA
jgi:hypothetical protein